MRLAHRTRVAHGDTRRAAATPFAALILVLASQPAPLAQQETDAPPPAARPAGTPDAGADEQAAAADPSEKPTLDVTVDVTASLPDIDRLVAAEGLRVGAAEGAQLISAAYLSIDADGRPQDLTYYQPGRNIKLTLEFGF